MEQFAYWVHDGGSIRVGSRRHPDGYTPEPNPTIIEHNEALMADAIDVVVPEARPDGDRSDTEENRP